MASFDPSAWPQVTAALERAVELGELGVQVAAYLASPRARRAVRTAIRHPSSVRTASSR